MLRLMLLRHAKSDRGEPGVSDHDRPLNPRGLESAPKVGVYMAAHGLAPDLVLASPAKRAQQTLDLALAAFHKTLPETSHGPANIVSDRRLYMAQAEAILEIITGTAHGVHTLLIVGHNPGFADLTIMLIGSGDEDARRRLEQKFPTAGLAVIDFAHDDWSKIAPGSGRLDGLFTPRWLPD